MKDFIKQIEQTGGIPNGHLQATFDLANGENLIPKWRLNEVDITGADGKQKELLHAGLRYQEKAQEFNDNSLLTAHAYKYGDKRTRQALVEGFSDDEKKYMLDFADRLSKYSGEKLDESKKKAMNEALGSNVSTQAPSLQKALFKGESNGNYNIVNRGARHGYKASTSFNLGEKTINEVLAEQQRGDYNAAGAYQIIPDTLMAAKKALGLTGNEKFDQATQDRIFTDYLTKKKRPQIYNFITGKSNDLDQANLALAQEWASVDRGNGRSFYDKDGVNKARIPASETKQALQDMRTTYQMNLEKGMSPDEAYRNTLTSGGLGGGSQYGAMDNTYTVNTETSNDIKPAKQSRSQQETDSTPQIDYEAQMKQVAKMAFQTDSEVRVPRTVQQAITGLLKGI